RRYAVRDGDEDVHVEVLGVLLLLKVPAVLKVLTCSNSYGSDTRPSCSSASMTTPLPWPMTANRGPAVTWSYDASWWLSEISSRRTYCRARSGRFVNRHSTAPSPSTCAG